MRISHSRHIGKEFHISVTFISHRISHQLYCNKSKKNIKKTQKNSHTYSKYVIINCTQLKVTKRKKEDKNMARKSNLVKEQEQRELEQAQQEQQQQNENNLMNLLYQGANKNGGVYPFEGQAGIYNVIVISEELTTSKMGNMQIKLEYKVNGNEQVFQTLTSGNNIGNSNIAKYGNIKENYYGANAGDIGALEGMEVFVNITKEYSENDKREYTKATLIPPLK